MLHFEISQGQHPAGPFTRATTFRAGAVRHCSAAHPDFLASPSIPYQLTRRRLGPCQEGGSVVWTPPPPAPPCTSSRREGKEPSAVAARRVVLAGRGPRRPTVRPVGGRHAGDAPPPRRRSVSSEVRTNASDAQGTVCNVSARCGSRTGGRAGVAASRPAAAAARLPGLPLPSFLSPSPLVPTDETNLPPLPLSLCNRPRGFAIWLSAVRLDDCSAPAYLTRLGVVLGGTVTEARSRER